MMIFTWPVYFKVDVFQYICVPYFSNLFVSDWSLCIPESLVKGRDVFFRLKRRMCPLENG